jgi:hypothetical protein
MAVRAAQPGIPQHDLMETCNKWIFEMKIQYSNRILAGIRFAATEEKRQSARRPRRNIMYRYGRGLNRARISR